MTPAVGLGYWIGHLLEGRLHSAVDWEGGWVADHLLE